MYNTIEQQEVREVITQDSRKSAINRRGQSPTKVFRVRSLVNVQKNRTHHIVVRLILWLFLLLFFLWCLRSSGITRSGRSATDGGSTTARADVREEVFYVFALQCLCEKCCPDGFKLDVG